MPKERRTAVVSMNRIEKAISKAYEYFPFGFDGVQTMGEWACGPTFIVKTTEEMQALEALKGGVYKQDPLWFTKSTGLLSAATHAKTVVAVSKDKHTMDRRKEKDKHGSLNEVGPSACTGRAIYEGNQPFAEMSYPLFNLGRAVGVVEYRHEEIGCPIYGFTKDGDLVVVLAPRLLDEQCRPEKLKKAA